MPIILETKDFTVKAHDKPHHSRENGGHLVIIPKLQYTHRYEMPLNIASDLMHLSMIVGEAFTKIMTKNGIEIIRINYQDNGNWAYKPEVNRVPYLHIHLYGRTSNERHPGNDPKFQSFPDAIVFPPPDTDYYDKFVSLTQTDCMEIKQEIIKLMKNEKYQTLSLGIL